MHSLHLLKLTELIGIGVVGARAHDEEHFPFLFPEVYTSDAKGEEKMNETPLDHEIEKHDPGPNLDLL